MSPCTPAHPPPMGALRPPRNLHFSFSDSPEPSTLLTGRGKSSLNRGETAMQWNEMNHSLVYLSRYALCQRSLYLSFKHRQQEKSAESALSGADKISTLLRASSTFLVPQNTTQISVSSSIFQQCFLRSDLFLKAVFPGRSCLTTSTTSGFATSGSLERPMTSSSMSSWP